jgi:small subunit ribosomal protein S16
MAVKIRLQRHGRKKAPFYHIVIADSRSPRDGKFIEKIGTYNPMTSPATIDLDRDAAYAWLIKGAQPTDTAAAILRFKGVMYRKHLERGVAKGVVAPEAAAARYSEFVESKEKATSDRFAQSAVNKAAKHVAIFGAPKAKKVIEAPVVETVVENVAGEDPEVQAMEAAAE